MAKVKLIRMTENPEFAVAEAAWSCYHENLDEIHEKSYNEIYKFNVMLAKSGHTSTFEHASFTFRITEVSRALTHQLVRHRMASYSQTSQRYVKFENKTKDTGFYWPEAVKQNDAASEIYEKILIDIINAYDALIDAGIKPEDARYLLPNATLTEIVVTMNARALNNFFNERLCNRAQTEIRTLASQMYRLVNKEAPSLFLHSGPACVTGKCNQGRLTCGRTPDYKLTH